MKRDDEDRLLSAQDLLAGSSLVHTIPIPAAVLAPGGDGGIPVVDGVVRLRPLQVGKLALISRAAREDAGLVPLLMIKEALVHPVLDLDQIRHLHIGLVQFLVGRINALSGLAPDGDEAASASATPIGKTHLLLAQHFGWTPDQVSHLTPGQVAVYLAGIQRLLEFSALEKAP